MYIYIYIYIYISINIAVVSSIRFGLLIDLNKLGN